MNELDSKLSDLLDDDDFADKTCEPRILDGKSSSNESEEEKHGNICNKKTILDHSLPSNSPVPIRFLVLAVENSWF
ncbi:hypothetical protein TNCV_5130741 [Trichonephila clavipes]|nr:hypothetical protein TNCV_5130741 [Trichonephila clavipes]